MSRQDDVNRLKNNPLCVETSTERLSLMSPSQIAEEMEAYLEAVSAEDYDPAIMDLYLNLLNEKAPLGEASDPELAYQDFQTMLRSVLPEEPIAPAAAQSVSNAPTDNRGHTAKKHGFLFRLRQVAAAFMIVLGCLSLTAVGAQACGVDVFGRLAQWTDEQFWFLGSNKSENGTDYTQEFQQALEEHELPKSLAPTWCPEGFKAGEIEIWDDDTSTDIQLTFNNPEIEGYFYINVSHYYDTNYFSNRRFEKDVTSVEEYISNGLKFYIFHNLENVVAGWSDEDRLMLVTIEGTVSVDEVKNIIDSMGGI